MSTSNPVSALSVWLALESPTHHAPGVNGMMDLVAAEVEGLPIAVESIAGPRRAGRQPWCCGRPRPRGRPVSRSWSHLDTVHPVGYRRARPAVRVEGDRLYGPASTT